MCLHASLRARPGGAARSRRVRRGARAARRGQRAARGCVCVWGEGHHVDEDVAHLHLAALLRRRGLREGCRRRRRRRRGSRGREAGFGGRVKRARLPGARPAWPETGCRFRQFARGEPAAQTGPPESRREGRGGAGGGGGHRQHESTRSPRRAATTRRFRRSPPRRLVRHGRAVGAARPGWQPCSDPGRVGSFFFKGRIYFLSTR